MDLLIVGLGAFGWLSFWKFFAASWGYPLDDTWLFIFLIMGVVSVSVELSARYEPVYWGAVALAGLGLAVLLQELFRLLQALVDVERARVLLSAQQVRRVTNP